MLTYLATPYSAPHSDIRRERFEEACIAAGRLLQRGEYVFSPIAHGHAIQERVKLPTDFAFWDGFCRTTLARCDRLAVLLIDGWRESVGVAEEIRIAQAIGLPVVYLDPETLADVGRPD